MTIECDCNEWLKTIMYEVITTTSASSVFKVASEEEADKLVEKLNNGEYQVNETPVVSVDFMPVYVCGGCGNEVSVENYYDNFVREGEHFQNDLYILLNSLAHFMQLADRDGSLEYKRDMRLEGIE